jgi:hypothetical protein
MQSISYAFGAALRFACNKNKRGFQILNGAGSSEEKRRDIFAAVLDLDSTFPARTII